MPHAAIIGMQGSGKTTLGLSMALEYRRAGWSTLVLDPHENPLWKADWMTPDLEKFLRKAKASQRCALFVEETGDEGNGEKPLGRRPGFAWLVTQAHHYGHVTHYLSQYHAQVPPVVRTNVQRLYMFAVGLNTAKDFAEQLAQPGLPALVQNLKAKEFVITGTSRKAPIVARLSLDDVRRVGMKPFAR